MSRPRASILINNYNYARFLGEAIDSALSQNYPRKEIIVVDDCSNDGTACWLRRSVGNKVQMASVGCDGALRVGDAKPNSVALLRPKLLPERRELVPNANSTGMYAAIQFISC